MTLKPNEHHCPQCSSRWTGHRAEHCTACHQTFAGTTSGDAHRVGEIGVDRRCEIQPYETYTETGNIRYGHWQDDKGIWKHGKKLTKEEREALFGKYNS